MASRYDLCMARHNENECAFCAADLEPDKTFLGEDWKVYCSEECARAEARMEAEARAATAGETAQELRN